MLGSRIVTAVAGILLSLLVSAVLWWQFETFAFFLFVPFLFGSSSRSGSDVIVRTCPSCGFQTRNQAYDYCPRDGTRLEERR